MESKMPLMDAGQKRKSSSTSGPDKKEVKTPKVESKEASKLYLTLKDESIPWSDRAKLAREKWISCGNGEAEQIFHCFATGLMKKKSKQLSTSEILLLWETVKDLLKSFESACSPKPSFITSISHYLSLSGENKQLRLLLAGCLDSIIFSAKGTTSNLILGELDAELELLEKMVEVCKDSDAFSPMVNSAVAMMNSVSSLGAKRTNHKKLPIAVTNLIPKLLILSESEDILQAVRNLISHVTFRNKDAEKYLQFLSGTVDPSQIYLISSIENSLPALTPAAVQRLISCIFETFIKAYGSEKRQGMLLSQKMLDIFESHKNEKVRDGALLAVLQQIAQLDLFVPISDPSGQDLVWLKTLFQSLITSDTKRTNLFECLKTFILIEPGLVRKNASSLLSLCSWSGGNIVPEEESFKAELVNAMGQLKQTNEMIEIVTEKCCTKGASLSQKVEKVIEGVVEPLTPKQVQGLIEKLIIRVEENPHTSSQILQIIRLIICASNFLRSKVLSMELLEKLTSLNETSRESQNSSAIEDLRISSVASLAFGRYHLEGLEGFQEAVTSLLEASKPESSGEEYSALLWLSLSVNLGIGKKKKLQKIYQNFLNATETKPEVWKAILEEYPLLPLSLGPESCAALSKKLVRELVSSNEPQPVLLEFVSSHSIWEEPILQKSMVRACLEIISTGYEKGIIGSVIRLFMEIPEKKFSHSWRKLCRQVFSAPEELNAKCLHCEPAYKAMEILARFSVHLDGMESSRVFGVALYMAIISAEISDAQNDWLVPMRLAKKWNPKNLLEGIFDEKTWSVILARSLRLLKNPKWINHGNELALLMLSPLMEIASSHKFMAFFIQDPSMLLLPIDSALEVSDDSIPLKSIGKLLGVTLSLGIQVACKEDSERDQSLAKVLRDLDSRVELFWNSILRQDQKEGSASLEATSAIISCYKLFQTASLGTPHSLRLLGAALELTLMRYQAECTNTSGNEDINLLCSIFAWVQKYGEDLPVQGIPSSKVLSSAVIVASMKTENPGKNGRFLSKSFTDATAADMEYLFHHSDGQLEAAERIRMRSALLELVMEGKLNPHSRKVIATELTAFLSTLPASPQEEDVYTATIRFFQLTLQLKGDIVNFGIKGREVLPFMFTWVSAQPLDTETRLGACIQLLNDCLLHQPNASIQMSSVFLGLFQSCIRHRFSLRSQANEEGRSNRGYHLISRFCLLLKSYEKEVEKTAPYLLAELVSGLQEWNPSVKERAALLPGIHALLDVCSDHSLSFLGASLPPASQHLLKSTVDVYSKYYKFRGNV